MRAFLSHSSRDKSFVSDVAQRLRRARVWLDEQQIESAADIRIALQRGIEQSDVFVVFLSRASLDSEWVRWELHQAERQRLAQALDKIAAFVIDPGVDAINVPTFLKNTKIRQHTSPRLAADDILRLIQDNQIRKNAVFFIGRSAQVEEAQSVLSDPSIDDPPNCINIFGLEGIGRRSLAEHIGRTVLGLTKRFEIQCNIGDNPAELVLQIENQLTKFSSDAAMRKRYEELQGLEASDSATALLVAAKELTDSQRILLLVDRGGLIDDEGSLAAWLKEAIIEINKRAEGYLFVVSRRKPVIDRSHGDPPIPQLRTPPLSKQESGVLLRSLFKKFGVAATVAQLNQLAEQVHGYPPAAYYAAELAKADGVDMVISNFSRVARLTEGIFLNQLERDSKIGDSEKDILVLLANYSPLPFRVIAKYMNVDEKKLDAAMRYLLDTSLIYPCEGLYRISEPIIHAVSRFLRVLDVRHKDVSTFIEEELDEIGEEDPRRLALQRLLYKALKFSGQESGRLWIRFGSDEFATAQEFYFQQEFEKAAQAAVEALQFGGDLAELRILYVKALIQLERYNDASSQIAMLERQGRTQDAAFLNGFMARKRRHHSDAIDHYNRARRLGRRGAALHRELAQCYYELREFASARENIAVAEKTDPDNRFLVDLKCLVAAELGNEREAYDALAVLEYVDEAEYYYQRKSRVDFRFGHLADAVEAARRAVHSGGRRPGFQSQTQLIKVLIEIGELDEAQRYLEQIDARFSGRNRDIRRGLRVKLLTARAEYDDALAVWEQLEDKSRPVHLALRLGVLQGKAARNRLSQAEELELPTLLSQGLTEELSRFGVDAEVGRG